MKKKRKHENNKRKIAKIADLLFSYPTTLTVAIHHVNENAPVCSPVFVAKMEGSGSQISQPFRAMRC